MTIIEIGVLIAAVLVLIPISVLVIESFFAIWPTIRSSHRSQNERPGCAILIPAHNEEAVLKQTLDTIAPQLSKSDRLIVIADNCDDGTPSIAAANGATVLERKDTLRRGKGFALDFGVRHLEANPPSIVILMDADCIVAAEAVDLLIREVANSGAPAQAGYVMDVPPNPSVRDQLSAFAFRFKNIVRPLGIYRLGLPCLLTGTGMAFPWTVLRDAPLGSSNIVEDMQLGLDLTLAGHAPRFCHDARVTGILPSGSRAASKQRKRWEHGHLQTLFTQTPRLLWAAVKQRRLSLLGLALELSVPPLSMLLLAWVAVTSVAVVVALSGQSSLPVWLLTGGAAALALAIFSAWVGFGRAVLPFQSLLAAPLYIVSKLPLYLTFFIRREKAWVRTERTDAPPQKPDVAHPT